MACIGENGLLGILYGVNLNSAATDTALSNLPSRWLPTRVKMTGYRLTPEKTGATTTLGATSTCTTGLFTGAGGTGTAIVATGTVASQTANTASVDRTIATTTTVLTASTVYFRVTTAQGAAAYCDVYLYGDQLD